MPVGLLLIKLALLVAAVEVGLRARSSGDPGPGPDRWTRAEVFCLAALLLAAGATRTFRLEDSPGGIAMDEFVVACTVQDLCNPARGHLDRVEPYFAAWSEGSTRVAAWLVRLRQSLEGPSAPSAAADSPGVAPPTPPRGIGTIRLANGLAGVLLVAVVYGLLRILGGPPAAVAGAGLAAVSPALIRQSRLALQSVDLALFPALALLALLLAMRSGRRAWYLGAGLAIGLAMRLWAQGAATLLAVVAAALAGMFARWAPVQRYLRVDAAWALRLRAVLLGPRFQPAPAAPVPPAAPARLPCSGWLLLGVLLLAAPRLGVALGVVPHYLSTQVVQTTVLTDRWLDLLPAMASNLCLAVGGLLGLVPVSDALGTAVPTIAAVLLVVALAAVRRLRVPGSGPLLGAFALAALVPPAIARVDPASVQNLAPGLVLVLLGAGLGAAALRSALGSRPVLRRLVLPAVVVAGLSPWTWLERAPFVPPEVETDDLGAVRDAARLSSWFEVHYAPSHVRSEQVFQLDARGLAYLDWAYDLHPLTPGLWVPHRQAARPPVFLVTSATMQEELQQLFPAGRKLSLRSRGARRALFVCSLEESRELLGWEGPPGCPGAADPGAAAPPEWWHGMLRIPAADVYNLRVTGPGELWFKFGGGEVVRGRNQVEAAGWFLEGYCPIEIGLTSRQRGALPRLEWRCGEDAVEFTAVPIEAIRRQYWTDPLVCGSSARLDKLGSVDTVADRRLPRKPVDGLATAMMMEPNALWLARWLPRPLWHYDRYGDRAPAPLGSAVSEFLVPCRSQLPALLTALEDDGGSHLLVPSPDQSCVLALSLDSDDVQRWPPDIDLRGPISLARWEGLGLTAVGTGTTIHVLDWRGRSIARWGSRPPADLAVGPDSYLYTLDPYHGRVFAYTPDGVQVDRWRCSELTPGSRVTVDSANRIWILLPDRGQVLVFGPHGRLLAPIRSVVPGRQPDTRHCAHREVLPGDLDSTQDGDVMVMLDGHLQRLHYRGPEEPLPARRRVSRGFASR